MGILNATPDSFSDGGLFMDCDSALRHSEEMVAAGAEIVDVGGESTRPGAEPVSEAQELDRVIPIIEALRGGVEAVISVDTSKPAVMSAAVAAGAGMINDVYALQQPGALHAAAATGLPVCLMHMQGEPRSMQDQPSYVDVVAEVAEFLRQRKEACLAAGLSEKNLIFDPGFGFGKTMDHNIALLKQLDRLLDLGGPVLVGLSRKSLLGQLLDLPVNRRAVASATLALTAVQQGARVVRVHDVAVTHDVIRTWEAVQAA